MSISSILGYQLDPLSQNASPTTSMISTYTVSRNELPVSYEDMNSLYVARTFTRSLCSPITHMSLVISNLTLTNY